LIAKDSVFESDLLSTGIRTFINTGQSTFSQDGSIYASCSFYGLSPNFTVYLDVYYFDRCSGELTWRGQDIYQGLYPACGVAFSPDSKLLYLSLGTKLMQYDMSLEQFQPTRMELDTFDGNIDPFHTTFFMLQNAPDGKIYMSANNAVRSLHIINDPNIRGIGCNFKQHSLKLPVHNNFGVPFIFNHYTTECCIDCFGIGGLIALYQIKAPEQLKSLLSNRYLLFTIIGLYLLSTLGYARPITSSIFKMELYNNLFRITERTFVSILSIWFIAWGIHFPNKNIIKISSTKIVRYLSKISYGIYIYHFLIASIMLKLLRMIGYNTDLFNFSWWMICLKFLVTFIIASISYEMIERPILSLKDKYFPTS